MKNIKTKSLAFTSLFNSNSIFPYLLMGTFLLSSIGCGSRVFEKSEDEISSTSNNSSSSISIPVGGNKSSSSIESSSSESSIQSIRRYTMSKIESTSGILTLINDTLFLYGNGVFKADTLKKDWEVLQESDSEFTFELFSFENQLYRLSTPAGYIQSYDKQWEKDKDLGDYTPQQIIKISTDTLLWTDQSSFSKIYSNKTTFQAQWGGLNSQITTSIEVASNGEIGICRGTFYWLDRDLGAFINSANSCLHAYPSDLGWLTFDFSGARAKLRIMDQFNAQTVLNLPDDEELPQVLNDDEGPLLFYPSNNELYRVSSNSIQKTNIPVLPNNVQSLIFSNAEYIAINSDGKLFYIKLK